MTTRELWHVSDALKNPLWDHNPDTQLGMTFYLGFPLIWLDGGDFGTLCVLENNFMK